MKNGKAITSLLGFIDNKYRQSVFVQNDAHTEMLFRHLIKLIQLKNKKWWEFWK